MIFKKRDLSPTSLRKKCCSFKVNLNLSQRTKRCSIACSNWLKSKRWSQPIKHSFLVAVRKKLGLWFLALDLSFCALEAF